MRKNSKTIENANLASMKSNTCNAHFCEKGIFSHDHRVRRGFLQDDILIRFCPRSQRLRG